MFKFKLTFSVLGILAVSGLALSGCAMHEDVVILDKRIQRLQKKVSLQESHVDTLRSEWDQGRDAQQEAQTDLRGGQADIRTVVNELREELQILRGSLEESQYLVEQRLASQADVEKRWSELERTVQNALDRVVRVEQHLGMEPSEKLVKQGQDKPAAKDLPAETPDAMYVTAKQHFDKGEYEKAREVFQSFLKKYPKSNNADNAQFWLGEVYYREKWFEKAILEYQKVIEKYPKGNKVRSALLKQGFSFLNLGDKDNARLILKELARKYPDSSEAGIAKDKLKQL